MTQIGLGYGQLIQNGMRSGMDAYRADQQLAMSRIAQQADLEQQSLRMDAMRQELEQRKQEAARYLQTEDANRQVFGAVMGAKPPVVNPDGTVTQDDWTQRLDPNVVQFADPKHQDMIVRHMQDGQAHGRKRAELTQQYQSAKSSGNIKFVRPELWRDWIDYGVPGINIDDAPEEVRTSALNRAENKKSAYIDMMTLHPATDGSGPPAIDAGLRSQLSALPPELVEDHYRRVWEPQQRAAQNQKVLADAYQAVRTAKEGSPEWSSGVAAIQANGGSSLLSSMMRPRTDPLADDRIRWTLDQAKGDVEQAAKEYKAHNQDEKNADGRLLPPTPDEVELAAQPDSGWLTSDSTWNRAKAKVDAWKKYEQAKKALDLVYKSAAKPQAPPSMQTPGSVRATPVDTIDEMIRRGMSDDEIEAAMAAGGAQ